MATRTLDQHIEVTPGIAADYDLELSDVYAALAYYFDHRAEIDEAIREGDAFVEKLRQETPSKLWKKLQERSHEAAPL